ncbi:MAG: phage head closure protein [Tissierellia bacterium]|nr:phage head closure protein [Tissierellia bacterium]
MLSNAVIKLITNTETINGLGDTVKSSSYKTVYADELSIGQNEFYQANANGLRPELKFEIFSAEYASESELEYDAKTYTIIRTYKKGLDRIELTCQGIVNGVV